MLFPLSSRVFPITVPPLRDLEGTHGDRVAGDNVTIASPLRATSSTRIDCYRSLFMSLVCGRKKQTRPLTCTLRQARRSLSRRLAARTPNKHIPLISTPWISVRLSAIQTQFGYHRACAISSRSDITATGDIIYYSATATKLQYHLCKAQISLLPVAIMTPISLFCLTALFVLFIMV